MTESRTTARRVADTKRLLETAQSGWLSTAGADGRSHLIACTAWSHGGEIWVATRGRTRTARNLRATRHARLALGSTDDATLLDLEAEDLTPAAEAPIADGFRAAAGWDPREEGTDWVFVRFHPTRIQAYRGYEETPDSDVLRGGRWLA
jgi:Pyridoxamine 5'-phosphate oxidase